ncbi:hypothetical protein B5807_00918 [Epicoccum nigrum]|uniref:Uncharacterized protein n=1 Tax=Epicoccum nigrum TaxID=105696 RepID=A0A1Y2MH41_EPING|nr:hypothetical protein B5807_00918 [Epicoccum nigrum]
MAVMPVLVLGSCCNGGEGEMARGSETVSVSWTDTAATTPSATASPATPSTASPHPAVSPPTTPSSELKLAAKRLDVHPGPHDVGEVTTPHLPEHAPQRVVQIGALVLMNHVIELALAHAVTDDLARLILGLSLDDLVHRQRAKEVLRGLCEAADIDAADAEVVAGADEVGSQGEGARVRVDGLFAAARVGERGAETVPKQVYL